MNILFIGDIMGKPGRRALKEQFQKLIDEFNIDFTIVNVENAAGGFGITPKIAEELLSWERMSSLRVITSGIDERYTSTWKRNRDSSGRKTTPQRAQGRGSI